MKFPARPLLMIFDRAARSKGYIGTQEDSGGGTYEGVNTFADVIGVGRRAIQRARAEGWIDLGTADKIAVALGLLPIIIWPAEYNAWLGTEPPMSGEERAAYERWERTRDLQRQRQRDRRVA